MKRLYKFIAGNSRVTPVGLAIAVGLVLATREHPGWWNAPLYLGVLLCTLAAATFEPVQ